MRHVAGLIAAAAALAAGAAEAQQRSRPSDAKLFCHDLKRTLKAASYDDGFEHLERSRAAPPQFGFRPGACHALQTSAAATAMWRCYQTLAPESLALATLVAHTAACLPDAKREASGYHWEAVFSHESGRIRITERGGPRAKVGRIVTLTIEAPGL